MEIKFRKLNPRARIPTRKHSSDAGLDLYALLTSAVVIPPHSFAIIPTGVAVKLFPGTVGLIWPKSRNDHLVGGGVVDANYRGELLVKVVNYSYDSMVICDGDAIAQLIIQPVLTPQPVEDGHSQDFFETDRGTAGGIVDQYKNTDSSTWHLDKPVSPTMGF
jgi:dUTP pyrophosphatase